VFWVPWLLIAGTGDENRPGTAFMSN